MISRQRKWQIERKARGICIICGKNDIHKGERCFSCYQPFKERSREYMKKRRENDRLG